MTCTKPKRRRRGGPVTKEGKKRSSLNALKHGLTARSPHALELMAEQCQVDFDEIHSDMRGYFLPADPLEDQLVRRIARCVWRLAMGESMEKRLLQRRAAPTRPGLTYDRIMKYERLVDIHLHRAIAALNTKRHEQRNPNAQNEL